MKIIYPCGFKNKINSAISTPNAQNGAEKIQKPVVGNLIGNK